MNCWLWLVLWAIACFPLRANFFQNCRRKFMSLFLGISGWASGFVIEKVISAILSTSGTKETAWGKLFFFSWCFFLQCCFEIHQLSSVKSCFFFASFQSLSPHSKAQTSRQINVCTSQESWDNANLLHLYNKVLRPSQS